MFKNSVLKPSVNTVKWLKASCIRAIKTMAQSGIAMIGTASIMSTVDWKMVISATLLSGILSVLTSISGIPEVENENTSKK